MAYFGHCQSLETKNPPQIEEFHRTIASLKKSSSFLNPTSSFEAHISTIDEIIETYMKLSNLDSSLLYIQYLKDLEGTLSNQDSIELINILFNKSLGSYYSYRGNYDSALFHVRRALSLYEKTGDVFDGKAVVLYDEMGFLFKQLYEFDSAYYFYKKSQEFRESVLPSDDTQLALAYANLASLLCEMGEYDSALNFYAEAKGIYQINPSKDIIDLANVKLGEGSVYEELEEFEIAMNLYMEALLELKNSLGFSHAKTADAFSHVGSLYYEKGENDSALANFQKGLLIREEVLTKNHPLVSSSLNNIGITYVELGRYDMAEKYYNQALRIRKSTLPENHLWISQSYLNLGEIHWVKGYLDSAIIYLEKALQIDQEIYGTEHPYLSDHFINIGIMFEGKGEYSKAIEYYQQGLSLIQKDENDISWSLAATYENLASVYSVLGDVELAHAYQLKAVTMNKVVFGEANHNTAFSYSNLAISFSEQSLYDSSLFYYQKALNYFEEKDEDHPDFVFILRELGQLYLQLSRTTDAMNVFKKALDLQNRVGYGNGSEYSATYNLMAQAYLQKGAYEKAITMIGKAISHNKVDLPENTSHILGKILQPQAFLFSLKLELKAYLNQYENHHKTEFLLKAFESLEELDAVILEMHAEILRFEDKIFLRKEEHGFYQKAVNTCISLYEKTTNTKYLEKAFYFSERSRSVTLKEAIEGQSMKELHLIPEHLLQFEKSLKTDISFYQTELNNLTTATSHDDGMRSYYKKKLFTLRFSLDSLKLRYQSDHPKYFELHHGNPPISIKELQRKLTAREALIEYFKTDSTYHTFVIDKNQFNYFKSENNHQIKDLIKQTFGNKMAGTFSTRSYQNKSFQLYQNFLAQPLSILKDSNKHLIVIPTPELSSIPFDLFVSDTLSSDYKKLNYLIKSHTISYGYSADLIFHKKLTKAKDLKPILALAPSYPASSTRHQLKSKNFRSALIPLKWNQAEAESISLTMGGNAMLGSSATEKTFKKEAPNYQVLHLAMHALVDHEESMNSKLVFTQDNDSIEDGMLHTFELFNMNLPAEMVVLSACNTGLGKIQHGEGVMSLARAFAYSGVPSLIISHWNVNDESTSKLMTSFYKHLAKGTRKDEALRMAKLDFLSEANEFEANPFYWGGFVVLGDVSPLQIQKTWNWKILVIVISCALILFLIMIIRKKRHL